MAAWPATPPQWGILSLEAFNDAVDKGLGRAVAAVRASGPGPYDDAIVESCLHDPQRNRYSEALRFPYQMRLIHLAGVDERARGSLLSGVRTTRHTGDLAFMLLVLGGYARRGDPEANRVLKEHAQKGDDWAQQILAHTGDANLEWLIENVLPAELEKNWSSVHQWIRRDEFPGSSPARKRLRAILRDHEPPQGRTEDSPPGPELSPRVYLDALRTGTLPEHAHADFCEEATDEEYRELVESWLADPSGPAKAYAFWTFARRPLPVPFARLFEVAENPDGRRALHHVLRNIRHPEARLHALERIRKDPIPFDALDGLRRNFEPGDENAIRAALPQLATQEENSRFGVLLTLLDLMEEYDGDWQAIAEWIYEHADDSWQRREVVEWMAKYGALPEAIRDEGIDDAEPAVRRICRAAQRNAS